MHQNKLSKALLLVGLIFGAFPIFCAASPPGGMVYPKANQEATEKLKEAYAAYYQGQYERAIDLAMDVYRKYGNVHARWWQKWVKRFVKWDLPDPYDHGAILGATIEGKAPLSMMVTGITVGVVLEWSYLALGYHGVYGKGTNVPSILRSVEGAKERGYRPAQPPPKQTWRPLPLRFREEDYFVLVPLDEACKVLGISFRLDISPKTKRIRYVLLGEKGRIGPGLLQARNLKGEREHMAYAPFEEDGEVWVPFYWLAKQVGIRWWEVRNGKIYVEPKKP